jgi:hypothetical protein
MTDKILPIATGLAFAALVLGYGLGGWWAWAPVILVPGVLWLVGQRQGWGWTAQVGFVCLVLAAAIGLWLDLATGWMLSGAVFALCAWDLDHFSRRVKKTERIEEARSLEQRHLQRLLIVVGLGLSLAILALEIKLRLTFLMALLLGLLAILGLSRTVAFLRRESD